MQLNDLLKLIDNVSRSNIDSFRYESGDIKLNLKKNKKNQAQKEMQSYCEDESNDEENLKDILSGMVGTFYTSPKEGEKPFVSVGEHVNKGQIIGIVEAMKLMNEVISEESGTIREICVKNEEPVEYGQKLFVIETE